MTGTFKKVITTILAIVMVMALLLSCVACKPSEQGGNNNAGNNENNDGIQYEKLSDEEYLQAMAQKELDGVANLLATGVGAYANMAGASIGNYGATAELKLMLGDLIIDMIENTMLQSTDMTMDFSFLSNIGLGMEIDSTADMKQLSVALGLSDTEIVKLLLLMNDESVWLGAPDLSQEFLKVNFADLGVAVNTATPAWMEGMMTAIPSEEKLAEILQRYVALALNEIDKVERSAETLTLDGLSQDVTKLSAKIYEEDALDAVKAILTAAKTDADIKKIVEDFGKFYNDMMEEAYADPNIDMVWEDVDAYAEFTKAIDEALQDLPTEPEDTENPIALNLYVDAKYNVVGFDLTLPEEETPIMTTRTVTDGDAFKTSIEVAGGQLKITGSGTTKDGIVTGTYAITAEDMPFVNVELKDFDATDKDALSGTITLKPTEDAITAIFGGPSPLPIKDIALEIKLDTTKDKANYEIKLIGDGSMVLGLALKAATKAPAALQAPTNTVDPTDNEALAVWVSGINFDGVLDNLTEAGVPEILVTALEGMLGAA